jgi:hypothetical protein
MTNHNFYKQDEIGSKGKMTKKPDYKPLTSPWGDQPRSSAGSGKPSGGFHVSNARDAGVTRDHRLTAFAQKLAAEMEQDALEQEQREDTRSLLEKKYNVRNGVSHVTPEGFRTLFLTPTHFRKIEKLGVREIIIDNGVDFQARLKLFSAQKNAVPSWDCSNVIYSAQVNKNGLAACLSGHASVVFVSRDDIYGLITVEHMSPALATQKRTKTQYERDHERQRQNRIATGNFSDIFRNAATLKLHVEHQKGQGGTEINYTTRSTTTGATLNHLGNLFHPDDAKYLPVIEYARLMPMEFSTLGVLLSAITMHPTIKLAKTFRESHGLIIHKNGNPQETLAILIRPEAYFDLATKTEPR